MRAAHLTAHPSRRFSSGPGAAFVPRENFLGLGTSAAICKASVSAERNFASSRMKAMNSTSRVFL